MLIRIIMDRVVRSGRELPQTHLISLYQVEIHNVYYNIPIFFIYLAM